MDVIKGRGYRFISLEQALQDSVYQFPDKYIATSDWLALWAFSKGIKMNAPAPPEYIQQIFNGK
jgi:hypothetical protein